MTSSDVPLRRQAPDAGVLRPRLPSPLREVADERFARHGVRLLLKRDDLIHPELIECTPTGVGGKSAGQGTRQGPHPA